MIKPPPQTAAQRQAKRRAKVDPKKVDITPRTRTLLTQLHRSTGLPIDAVIWQALFLFSEKLAVEAELAAVQRGEVVPSRVDVPPILNPPGSQSQVGDSQQSGRSGKRSSQLTAGEVSTADPRRPIQRRPEAAR